MWAVYAVYRGERKKKVFTGDNSRTEAEGFLEKLKDKFAGKDILLGIVSTVSPIPVNMDKEKPKGEDIYWCPYCGEWRQFEGNKGDKCCPLCGVGLDSFQVKSVNKLWPRFRFSETRGKKKDS